MAITNWINIISKLTLVLFVLASFGFVLIVECRPTSAQVGAGGTAHPPKICDVTMDMDHTMECKGNKICVQWSRGVMNGVEQTSNIWLYYCSNDCIQRHQTPIDICHIYDLLSVPYRRTTDCSPGGILKVEWHGSKTNETNSKNESRIVVYGHLTAGEICPTSN